jgi:hypothetical protein
MRNKLRFWLTAASLAGSALLSGCGGGGSGDAVPDPVAPPPLPSPATVGPPVVDSARSGSASIGPAGGTLRTTAADGVEYTLTVPAGALTETVTIRMTPIVDFGNPALASGLTGAVQFEPSGLRFARDATLRIGAVGVLPAGSRRVGFTSASDGTRMQLTLPAVVNGGTEILVLHFSSAGAADWTPGQIEQAPLDPSTDKSNYAFWDQAVMDLDVLNVTTVAAVLTRWLDEFVNPEIAKASGDLGSTFDADEAYGNWLDGLKRIAVLMGGDAETAIPALLAPAQEQTKTALARKFLPFIDNSLTVCQIVIDVSNASAIQRRAAAYGIDTVEFGLDRPSFLREVNDCLRPVLDPIRLPSPLSPGQPVSLDARAQVVFNGRPDPVGAGFEFTITATDATVATPTGLSDGDGRYTTVFTPSTAAPSFNVRACLALQDGSTLSSDVCVTQQVGSQSVVLAGQITVNQGSGGNTVRGAVDFRVRADLDGTLTVAEASGQVTKNTENQFRCPASGEQVTLRSQTVDTITQGRFFLSAGRPPEISAFGPGVRTAEALDSSSCAVVTSTRNIVDSDEFSSTPISAIERGADGLPTVITFSAAGYSGRLVRE